MIAFAHRGRGGGHADNTLAGFLAARDAGIGGIETDAWVSRDDVAVLDHDGVVPGHPARSIRDVARTSLPPHIPSASDFYAACGTDLEMSVDVKDAGAAHALVAATRDAGGGAAGRLWLCHENAGQAAAWADLLPEGHRVWSPSNPGHPLATRWPALREAVAAMVRSGRLDVINLHPQDCTPAMAAECLALGAMVMVWGVNDAAELERVRALGAGAVHSDSHEICRRAQDGPPA